MKAKVKETGEIIDVKCLYSVTYSRLDCNNKIVAEYDEDELEFLTTPKTEEKEKSSPMTRKEWKDVFRNAMFEAHDDACKYGKPYHLLVADSILTYIYKSL
jgi:hypothetical protein